MMPGDTNWTPERPLTFFDAMRVTSFVLSSALKVSVGFMLGWLQGGVTVSSIVTVPENGSGDTASVSKLVLTFKNVTVTWEKRHVTVE